MWQGKVYDFQKIGIEGLHSLGHITKLSGEHISYFENPSKIFSKKGDLRANYLFSGEVGHGSYGNLHLATRSLPGGDIHQVVCKQPRMKEMNQIPEAILQHLSHLTLKDHGIPWAVPCVYDVFLRNNETWFSMEPVRGTNLVAWIQKSNQPDKDILLLICQVALITCLLQKNCGLDHRDLKIDNLMIRETPCQMSATLDGKTWKLAASFQVVILDFGFACLGSLPSGTDAVVNLGDVLPPMDPCPKEGRDIFHFLISIMGLAPIREKMSPGLILMMDEWLNIRGKNFGAVGRRWSHEGWVHLLTGQRDFQAPLCSPIRILENCSQILNRRELASEIL